MCNPAVAAFAALAAAGAATKYVAQRNAAKATDAATAQAIRENSAFNQQATQKVVDATPQFKATERGKRLDAATTAATNRGNSAVEQAAIRTNQGGPKVSGRLSKRFVTGEAKAAQKSLDTSKNLARLLGVQTANSTLRQNEGIAQGDLGTQLSNIARNAQGIDYANRININEKSRPNAGLMFLGDLAQGIGTAGAGAGFGGAGAGAGAGAGSGVASFSGPQLFPAAYP